MNVPDLDGHALPPLDEEDHGDGRGGDGEDEKMEDVQQGNGWRNGNGNLNANHSANLSGHRNEDSSGNHHGNPNGNLNGNGSESPPRPSAYQYTAEHLRQSSANRIDLNRLGNGNVSSTTTYSHVFSNHEHADAVHRGNLNGHFQAMSPDGNLQSMFHSQSAFGADAANQHPNGHPNPHGNEYENQHPNPYHSAYPNAFGHVQNAPPQPFQPQPQQQRPSQIPSWIPPMPPLPAMPQMPPIPQIPTMPQLAQMPNVTEIVNNAMSGVNAVFGGPPFNGNGQFPPDNGH